MDKVFLVRDDTEPALLANFEYSASTGGVAIERIFHTAEPPSKSLEVPPLTTSIEYNSPGYPTSWENAFFKEEISYTNPGYGDVPMGQPAYPTALTWTGTWGPAKTVTPERIAQSTGLKLSSATRCHTALIAARYLDLEGYILRRFVPVLDVENLPIICNFGEYAWGIEKLMGSVTSLRGYGYSFQYGNYKELLKAKFYDPRDVTERPYCTIPLTLTTLKNALDKPQDTVKNLWKQLGDKKYILEDSDKGRSGISHGEAGDSLLNGVQMTADLSNLIPGETLFEYAEPIGRVLGTRIGKTFGKNEFSDMFVKWQENLSNQTDVIVDTIWSMFSKQGYLDANGAVTSKVLDAGFSSIVSSIQNLDVSSVFKTLLDFFLCGVNTSAQDMQVYQSDMHGNMELFYNGQDRLNFTYKAGTNQILGSVLTLPSGENESRTYTHDINGNLNSISQDGAVLLNLTYDPLTNRPTLVKLLDGTELRFAYDYKGERVFKKVFDKNGQLVKEIRYLGRDLDRKVLTDQVLTYLSPTLPPKVVTTSYFYGPRGLFGFLRDGTYYTVLVDRIGSPRLILRNGEVVDGFNYLPYGKVSSTWKLGNVGNHGTDPILRYLFTGQELDEETGLYNFHYRMYDPTLGRFYQVDPDEQYFSPYKYAGNSPILMVDPDGRFGFLIFFIAVGLGLLFGYLGMAAANGTWDPTKWHWDKWQTWVAGIIGFVSGFLLPYGFVGTAEALVGYLGISSEAAVVLTIGLGVGGAYLSAAANFNDFNPAHWDWSSPGAWNALFNGFAFGSNIVGGVKEVFVFYDKLDSVAMKALLIGGSTFTGAGLGYISGVMANQLEDGSFQWNPAKWNVNGATFFAVVTGGLGGATLPVGLIGLKDALFGSPKEAVPFADEGQELMEMSSVRHGSISSMDTVTMVFDDSASLFSEGIEALQDTVRNDDAFIDNSFNLPYNTNNDVANFVRNTDRNLPLITFIVENLNMNLDNLIRHLGPKRARSLRLNAPINFTEPAILVFLANNDYIVLEGVGKGFHPDGGVYLFNSTSNPDLFNMLAESTGQVGTIPVGNLTVDIANFLSLRNAAAITTFMTTWGNAVRSELVKIAGVEPSLDSAAFQEEVVRRLMHAINSQPKLDLSKNEVVNWVVMTAMEGSLRDVLLNPIKEKDDNASDQLVDVLGRMGQLVAGSNIVQIIASNQTPNYTDVMLPLSERWDIPTSCVQSGEICVNGPPQVEVGSVPFLTSFKAKPENHIVPNSILSNDGLVRGMNILDMVDFTNVSHVDPLLEKLTSFDGLDGFCYFNNATSCPNKENLGNDSFENEIFVRNRVRRAAREESATSSSSSLHGSNMITRSVKLIRGLWDRISPVKPKTDKSHPTQSDILHSKTRSQNQAGSPSMWKKCVPWAHDGLGYVDGFTCMGNKGVVSVVPLSPEALENNPTSLMTTDYGDTYRDCTFYRDPTRPFGSAHCTGNKSEIHYTSWMEQRPFDHLNDHLLMVALILHFIRVSKDDEDNVKSDLISTDDEKMTMWRQTLDDIANMLEFLTIRNDADQWCSVWGRRLLQDRIDDWDTFNRKGAATLEEFEIFEEDLEALCEEVGELVDNAMKLL
ncbi:uncharacterized protein LOC110849920 isoform X1 [Folsomia candida]|uniref:uncharacterized protein LOC110849920 isoform X1 n=1 Tax=Folsomia candida TaxID=158441 RepID=UPI0016050291|nr:uncharacterized protein LOC110849920 isoform X1 [Folsomia candida]XP_035707570.1 uncharacterized protein LOC110849920 isoform X1 [Folsomia candida]XP_035707572.1 uncharacterized protein LOC110849920 isoform X1 [Folsomia candida]XP_035707573.1 uncharacterized protein LOC110849920 isoform X1 [Folsomia candida]XP_035707574.1 uncharacterized protein LOC110849920 isoform X1 [Folsomia candida]